MNASMTVEQLRDRVEAARLSVRKTLVDLEEETGCHVLEVDLFHLNFNDDRGQRINNVFLGVRL
jgi:hypothetical protein